MKLLVVEDNPKITAFLSQGFSESGFYVDTCLDGDEGFQMALSHAYDVVILDIMLPGMDGLRLTSELRKRGNMVPILLLTALDKVDDKVRGLDCGADDYLSKPFAFSELLARVHALCRRSKGMKDVTLLSYRDVVMDTQKHTVKRGERPLELTLLEYNILELFLQNPERLLTRTTIMERVWDMNYDSGTNILDVHICHLRKKMDEGGERSMLLTIRGVGYMLKDAEC